uniref:Uncharacterized protein n=1 Tax=Rhizophora mucronata TaxID=61149 RepID=A0A2P2PFG0_RHIMU
MVRETGKASRENS